MESRPFSQMLNITNVYEDHRFDPSVDANSDFRHNDILCMPIKNTYGRIIGVIQVKGVSVSEELSEITIRIDLSFW